MVTFLFTDIEASSLRWEQRPDEMRRALRHHDEVLRAVVEGHSGAIIRHTGDGFNCVFTSSQDAVAAAAEGQRQLQLGEWGEADRLLVRMGLHCGELAPSGDDYYGPPVNRAARVMNIANGDQIAISGDVATELGDQWELCDLGLLRLKGIGTMQLFFVGVDGLTPDPRAPRMDHALAGSRLPADTTKLIGRDDEVAELSRLLDQRRLVSVIGIGGLGKTSIAASVARAIESRFAEGVTYCDLTQVSAAEDVAGAVAQALGARAQPEMGLDASIVNFIEGRDLLLVLDNCEHVLRTAQRLVDRLLSVKGPRVLATSRERLSVAGEQVYPLSPLTNRGAAIELFVSRAIERDPSFSTGFGDEDLLAEICERLEGIPLAIELAAARARVMPLAELRDRLDDRFKVMRDRSGTTGLPALHAAVAWSHEQLADDEVDLFDQLSVFAGGFTLDAATAVFRPADSYEPCDPDDVLDLLMVLIDKALIQSERGTGRIRFSMLETLRDFGAARLVECSEHADAARRHATFFAELATARAKQMFTAAEATVWDELALDWGNLRMAQSAALVVDDTATASDLMIALGWYSAFAMRMETFVWVDDVLARHDAVNSYRRAELLALKAMGGYLSADPEAIAAAEESLQLDPTDPTGLARLSLAGNALNNTFDWEQSALVTEAMLEHARDDRPITYLSAVAMRTFHLCLRNPSPAAIEMATQAVALADETQSASAMGIAQWAWGLSHIGLDWDVPLPALTRGLDYTNSLHEHHLMGHLITGIVVHFTAVAGDEATAIQQCADAVRAALDSHYLVGTSHLLGAAAVALGRVGEPLAAGRLVGAMAANGHAPRRDVRKMLNVTIGDNLDELAKAGAHLSIRDAGNDALASLEAAAAALANEHDHS